MARLVILRGETRDTQTLEKLPVRIGRGPQNDVVLEDPAKSVSRAHAEIRLEGGRYVLVDLKSDNGIWVAGIRVPRVELKPNVVASIGPFRLMLEGDETAAANAESETKISPPNQGGRSRQSTSGLSRARSWTTFSKWAAGIAAGLAIAAAIATAVIFWPPKHEETPQELITQIAEANSLIVKRACAEAIARIDAALARYPGNTDLLALKRQAEACVAPPPPPPPPPNWIAENLERARELITAGDCSGALGPLADVLTAEPENVEALELKTQADKCAPARGNDSRPVLAQRIPPAAGGLDTLVGELDRDYKIRVAAMRARYDEAVVIAAKGPSRQAISLFEGIVKETPPGYLDVAAKLADATRAWRATARILVTEGRELAGKEMWIEAIAKFRAAVAIDPTLSLDDDIRSAEAAKVAKGQQLCKLGKQTINYNRAQGVQHYKQAFPLLPPEDPCYADAKRYAEGN